jgi:transposase InsO family protein
MESSIDEFIFFFNKERPHQSFNYLTPVQVEAKYYKNK